MSKLLKKDVLDIINLLIDDVESQSNSLEHNNDVKWDCYNIDNWNNMVENLYTTRKYVEEE